MLNVAFTTYGKAPEINDDDRLAAELLSRSGVEVVAAVWDDPNCDWSRFDCVVIRSNWDYHLKPDSYKKWLRRLAAAGVRLWNPPEVVLENINKRYLTAMAEQGTRVVPTLYLPAGEGCVLTELLKQRGWEQVVIKPAISGCAHGTWRTSLATSEQDQTRFTTQIQSQDILIQPYVPEIAAQGEWSLIFFNGEFSHAALKRPSTGDFRVQREFGGTSAASEPGLNLIEQARSILAPFHDRLLYARVDGFERDGQFVLMELEINEPFLFLGYCDGAANRFAQAIIQRLRSAS